MNYQFGVEKRYTGMFIDKFCSHLANDDEDESVNNDEWDDERDEQRLDFVI